MSGGSFDYLYCKFEDQLLDGSVIRNMQSMVNELREQGYDDVADSTQELLDDIQATQERFKKSLEKLSPVWREVEYLHSLDGNKEDVKKAVLTFRQK